MALKYDYRYVKNADKFLWDDQGNMEAKYQAVIFETINIGMNEITKDNFEEFHLRHKIISELYDSKPYITKGSLKKMIGLWTNARPMTKGKFKTDMKRRLGHIIDRKLNK
jgi:hypothetical protein